MFDALRAFVGGGDRAHVIYECRHCGATVDDPGDPCPDCGATEIAQIRL